MTCTFDHILKTNVKSKEVIESIDIFLSEMEKRFKENSDILLALSDSNELPIEKLQSL